VFSLAEGRSNIAGNIPAVARRPPVVVERNTVLVGHNIQAAAVMR
jgi:hypothetical protein